MSLTDALNRVLRPDSTAYARVLVDAKAPARTNDSSSVTR